MRNRGYLIVKLIDLFLKLGASLCLLRCLTHFGPFTLLQVLYILLVFLLL